MFEIFSTREIAILALFAALIVYVTLRSNGKMPFRDLALYHDLFVLILIRNKDGEKILSKKKKKVRRACGLSYWRIQEFRRAYTDDFIGKICFGNDDNSFFDFVDRFRKGGRGGGKFILPPTIITALFVM